MNAIKEEQLGMDHAFRTLIEKLQLLKLVFEEKGDELSILDITSEITVAHYTYGWDDPS